MRPPSVKTEPARVAQYVRMSTDHQRYSTHNQSAVIEAYARRRDMEIVQTYADQGKSGLNLAGREALKQMLADVMSDAADFEAILVYDVSRWGRFQDTDESAYYEFICRQAGVRVYYCAEQFENDGSPTASIIKTIKRAMASEYSRELSTKVFAGQAKLASLGYRVGSYAGYGLRRQLLAENGAPKALLAIGEQKSIATDRVILVPGPADEVATVRRIYHLFVRERLSMTAIAELLNGAGLRTHTDKPWSFDMVKRILSNEKYVGNNVFNRSSRKLKGQVVNNPPDLWVRVEHAFEPIVDAATFEAARKIFAGRARHMSDDAMLAKLSKLLAARGSLSATIIKMSPDTPHVRAYQGRFGSLEAAYKLIDYDAAAHTRQVKTKQTSTRARDELLGRICRYILPPAGQKL